MKEGRDECGEGTEKERSQLQVEGRADTDGKEEKAKNEGNSGR